MVEYYIIKYNFNKLKQNTIVEYICCTYSGNCYLVEDINTKEREWIMYYNLEEYIYTFNKNKIEIG